MYKILEHKSTLPRQVWESASLDIDFEQLLRTLPTTEFYQVSLEEVRQDNLPRASTSLSFLTF